MKTTQHLQSPITQKEKNLVLEPLSNILIQQKQKNPKKTLIIGIQGGQGTGKSTMTTELEQILTTKGYKTHHFSIDDFYTSSKDREIFRKKHPTNSFYQIARGMPGTHNLKTLTKILDRIQKKQPFAIPIFDKSLHNGQGDQIKKIINVRSPQDIILFEGWCVAIPNITKKVLQATCKKYNFNLKKLDPTGKSQNILIQQIKEYQPIWKKLNYMIMLKPPNPQMHKIWRNQAEQQLKKSTNSSGSMTTQQINHFVDVFLPLTYVCYDKIKPNCIIDVNKDHTFSKINYSN